MSNRLCNVCSKVDSSKTKCFLYSSKVAVHLFFCNIVRLFAFKYKETLSSSIMIHVAGYNCHVDVDVFIAHDKYFEIVLNPTFCKPPK